MPPKIQGAIPKAWMFRNCDFIFAHTFYTEARIVVMTGAGFALRKNLLVIWVLIRTFARGYKEQQTGIQLLLIRVC